MHFNLLQVCPDATGAPRLCCFSADQSGPDALVKVFEYNDAGKLVHQTQLRVQVRGCGLLLLE